MPVPKDLEEAVAIAEEIAKRIGGVEAMTPSIHWTPYTLSIDIGPFNVYCDQNNTGGEEGLSLNGCLAELRKRVAEFNQFECP